MLAVVGRAALRAGGWRAQRIAARLCAGQAESGKETRIRVVWRSPDALAGFGGQTPAAQTIWVTGLDPDIRAQVLADAFVNCGPVEQVSLIDDLRLPPDRPAAGRTNVRAWRAMQPLAPRRAAFVRFASEVIGRPPPGAEYLGQEGRLTALRPELRMLGIVVPSAGPKKGGAVCRPHPAEWRRSLIVREGPAGELDPEFELLSELQRVLGPYLWVRNFRQAAGPDKADYCLLKCSSHVEAQAALEMLRIELAKHNPQRLLADWALDRPRADRIGLVI